MQSIAEETATILSLLLGVPVTLQSSVTMAACPAWDSMKHIEIIMTIEEHFDVSFAPQDIPLLTSQDALIAKVKELTHA